MIVAMNVEEKIMLFVKILTMFRYECNTSLARMENDARRHAYLVIFRFSQQILVKQKIS